MPSHFKGSMKSIQILNYLQYECYQLKGHSSGVQKLQSWEILKAVKEASPSTQ